MGEALKDQKILCLCQRGNVRSVGTRRRLNRRHFYNVISGGVETTGPETMEMLCRWADKILIAEPWMADGVPESGKAKIVQNFTIGPDLGWEGNSQALQDIIGPELNKLGLR